MYDLVFAIGFLDIHWVDILDILLVSAVLFNFYKLVRGTVALRVFIGFLLLYFLYLIIQATEMKLLTAILGQFMGVGVIAVVILFQQEIKRFLVLLGRTTALNEGVWQNIFGRKDKGAHRLNTTALLDAMKTLGGTNTGALIVVSASDELNVYAETGDILDAELSKRLLISIFFKNSPLHDGAVILTNGRIKAARCLLPVSQSENIPPALGTRHRAAIGMSEQTSTMVLIVSEETGEMSIAHEGKIYYNLSTKEIREELNRFLNQSAETTDL
ncbi:MAG: diadenylate cyclase CdaA [Bernardetiaceae bacterium]|nr:diadenylate cyclase CdaA [Bernardetiaceae bacterium]